MYRELDRINKIPHPALKRWAIFKRPLCGRIGLSYRTASGSERDKDSTRAAGVELLNQVSKRFVLNPLTTVRGSVYVARLNGS
jgi:hypothetical protein